MAGYSVVIVPKQRTPSSRPCGIKTISLKVQRLNRNYLEMKNAFNLLKLIVNQTVCQKQIQGTHKNNLEKL